MRYLSLSNKKKHSGKKIRTRGVERSSEQSGAHRRKKRVKIGHFFSHKFTDVSKSRPTANDPSLLVLAYVNQSVTFN
jgi:hypothetical protein